MRAFTSTLPYMKASKKTLSSSLWSSVTLRWSWPPMPRSRAARRSATNAPLATLCEIAIEPEALSSVVAELKKYANAAEPAGSGRFARRATASAGASARTAAAVDALASDAMYSLRCSGKSRDMGTHASRFLSAAVPVSSIDAVPSGARPTAECAAAAGAAAGCARATVAWVTICRTLPPASA